MTANRDERGHLIKSGKDVSRFSTMEMRRLAAAPCRTSPRSSATVSVGELKPSKFMTVEYQGAGATLRRTTKGFSLKF
jgi:hypothetical protein